MSVLNEPIKTLYLLSILVYFGQFSVTGILCYRRYVLLWQSSGLFKLVIGVYSLRIDFSYKAWEFYE